MKLIRDVSISGGKDSLATAIIALDQYPDDDIRFVTADTGNEHEDTIDYIQNYLPSALGVKIDTVRADFSRQIAVRRENLSNPDHWVHKKWKDEGISDEKIKRVIDALIPTGNPFLDLCIWKGKFPSRRSQFCTHELKVLPISERQAMWMADGIAVESWQGVRRDESDARKNAKPWEIVEPLYWIRRPIVDWTAQQTIDLALSRGIKPNPLYSQGMGRVGCMPCVNCNKDELLAISQRFPHHIERIAAWEIQVGMAGKRDVEGQTFFTAEGESNAGAYKAGNIWQKIEWAKTSRGGKQYNFLRMAPPSVCQSAYGLCE